MTSRFRRMAEVYKLFADDYCDFSEEALQEMFEYESTGKGNISIDGFNGIGKKANRYAVGKKNLNITVAMWFERLGVTKKRTAETQQDYDKRAAEVYENREGWFPVFEDLFYDGTFPHWWLIQIFRPFLADKKAFYVEQGTEWLLPCEIFLMYFE